MQARYAPADLEVLLDPQAKPWRSAKPVRLSLIGAPLGLQPSATIRAAWMGKRIGAVDRVTVAALHNGSVLAFRLEWNDPSENREPSDNTSFSDAAAVLLPATLGAPIMTMGAPGAPVNAWYWRADENSIGRHVVSEGLGTTRTIDLELVRAAGIWKERRWRIVIARPLRVETAEPVAQLRPGERSGFGIAVWEGHHGERAGIKAFSGDWRELRLAPVPTARR